MPLPTPTDDALAASHALQSLISTAIVDAGGWLPFDRYMDLVLYAPGLGYYSGGSTKLGKDGDFTTAPEISPLFGASLAQLAGRLLDPAAPHLLEFGAGTGRLAHDILSECARAGIVVDSYTIVELSGQLRARQQDLLRDFRQVVWLDALPAAFNGVVFGNEVLDAMPVQLVEKHGEQWREVGVVVDEQGRYGYDSREANAALREQIALQIADADALPDGYLTEVHATGCGFMHSLAAMLAAGRGAALLFDYGFPGHEYYHPQRDRGTLMCHYRHHAHDDPFYLPGLQDLTAHVDFTAMARAALAGGAEVLGYTSQAQFLLAAGIAELLQRTDPADARVYLPQANALQKLVSPAEMGELFKVLAIGHGVALPDAFERGDRTHRL
ncbi:MAG TPA: SAM-dependent methyltransferase [Burkholderiaceae bacterium]